MYLNILKKTLHSDEQNSTGCVYLCTKLIIKLQAVSKTQLIFFSSRLLTSKSPLGNKCNLFQL